MASRECKDGHWAITVLGEYCMQCRQTLSRRETRDKPVIRLRLNNDEYEALDGAYRRAVATGSKSNIIHGNLEAASQRSCSKLSQQERNWQQIKYVLTMYGPYVVGMKYQERGTLQFRLGPFRISNSCLSRTCCWKAITEYEQYWVDRKVDRATSGSVSSASTGASSHTPSSSTASCDFDAPFQRFATATRESHEGDPVNSQVIMSQARPGELVMGALPDGTFTQEAQGVQLTPPTTDQVLYADQPGNVALGIEKRITEKRRPVTLTKEDYQAIGHHVHKLIKTTFTKKAVEKAMEHTGMLELMKSAKWSDKRFEEALLSASCSIAETFPLKVSIKNEPVSSEKAPRMIIADGDVGQVMALAVTNVFEYILFEKFQEKNIKHASKQDAMERVLGNLALLGGERGDKPHSYIENDGSAWDTCCSSEIIRRIETPIFRAVWEHMLELGWPDFGHEAVHAATNSKKKLNMLKAGKRGGYSFRFIIESQQRSGRRPTSSSNWLINFVLELAAFNPSGEGRLHCEGGKTFTDRWGNKRKLAIAKEGDDTANSVSPRLTKDEEHDLIKFWERAGFNMKMFVRTRVLEFAGWKAPIVNGRVVTDHAVPDFIRNVHAAAITTSAQARESSNAWKKVAWSKYMSYSLALHKLPTVSRMFRRWAVELQNNRADYALLEKEDIRRLGVDDHDELVALVEQFETPDYEREEQILTELGILRSRTYQEFCIDAENQLREAANDWVDTLSYYE